MITHEQLEDLGWLGTGLYSRKLGASSSTYVFTDNGDWMDCDEGYWGLARHDNYFSISNPGNLLQMTFVLEEIEELKTLMKQVGIL